MAENNTSTAAAAAAAASGDGSGHVSASIKSTRKRKMNQTNKGKGVLQQAPAMHHPGAFENSDTGVLVDSGASSAASALRNRGGDSKQTKGRKGRKKPTPAASNSDADIHDNRGITSKSMDDDDTAPGAVHVNNRYSQSQLMAEAEQDSNHNNHENSDSKPLSELIVAELAPEIGDAVVVAPAIDDDNNSRSTRWLWIALGCCVVMVFIIVTLILLVLLLRKEDDSEPLLIPSDTEPLMPSPSTTLDALTPAPMNLPATSTPLPNVPSLQPDASTDSPTDGPTATFAPTSFYDYLSDLYFPTSTSTLDRPQSAAISWLVYEDDAFTQSTPANILRERYAMAVLYFSTDSTNWDWDSGTWLTGDSICNWRNADGVVNSCSGESRSYLYLGTSSFDWTIPTEIGLLTGLTYLSFWQNKIEGTIPSEIGLLSRLRLLSFSNNNMVGSLPSELGQLTQLTYLSVSNNKLTGSIPNEIASISTFRYLSLYNNLFTDGLDDGMFCALTDSGQLDPYKSDCGGELACQCCTVCCDVNGNCLDM